MLQIDYLEIPKEKWSLKCPYPMQPEGITVHNSATNASAMSLISYMIRNDLSTSFHFAVDETRAVQGLPINRNGWHAGDGTNGRGNRRTIAIEIGRDTGGKATFLKAEENAILLIVKLMKEFNWGLDRIYNHQQFSSYKKYCPHRTFDLGWDRFLKKIEIALKESEQPKIPDWAAGAVAWNIERKISDGTRLDEPCTRLEQLVFNKRLYDAVIGDLKRSTP